MPLQASFPDLPLTLRSPNPIPSSVPTPSVPSLRRLIPSDTPLFPENKPTENSKPLENVKGYQAKLFHCQCTPKCVEFVNPKDYPALHWIGSSTAPLKSKVICSGPPQMEGRKQGKPGKNNKFAEFDVDCKVAYEFNSVGFYNELLHDLDSNYTDLQTTNARGQAFLYASHVKHAKTNKSNEDPFKPKSYVPYYPTSNVERAFVQPRPLHDSKEMTAAIKPPSALTYQLNKENNQNNSLTPTNRSIADIEAELRQEIEDAIQRKQTSALPKHLKDSYDSATSETSSASSSASSTTTSSSNVTPASLSRDQLFMDRANFAAQLKQQFLGKMSISSV